MIWSISAPKICRFRSDHCGSGSTVGLLIRGSCVVLVVVAVAVSISVIVISVSVVVTIAVIMCLVVHFALVLPPAFI
jgi:hypothetical protein